MKLVTFEVSTPVGRFQRLGALLSDQVHVLDLNAAYAHRLSNQGTAAAQRIADAVIPPTMLGLIEGGDYSLDEARKTLAEAEADWNLQEAVRLKGETGANLVFHFSAIKLLTPLPNPNSLRDFIAFEEHVKKGYDRRGSTIPEQWYRMPIYYKGNHRSLLGPDQPVVWPRYTQKLDYELEWACILGKKGRNIPVEEAHRYIFGYTVLNDFSARDIQLDEMICRLGPAKGKDFATAIGPYIVTPDEIADPRNLRMTARINGELWSDGNTGTSRWTWEQMIAHVSMDEDVHPGDIYGSGTVGNGCGYEHDNWIKPGDTVELEVEGLGKLRNPVWSQEQAERQAAQIREDTARATVR